MHSGDSHTRRLASLIRSVPVHDLNLPAAREAGDHAALAYAAAILRWQARAAEALAEAEIALHVTDEPDVYARTATASALLRLMPGE